jgi:hypothetical protein
MKVLTRSVRPIRTILSGKGMIARAALLTRMDSPLLIALGWILAAKHTAWHAFQLGLLPFLNCKPLHAARIITLPSIRMIPDNGDYAEVLLSQGCSRGDKAERCKHFKSMSYLPCRSSDVQLPALHPQASEASCHPQGWQAKVLLDQMSHWGMNLQAAISIS